MNAIALVFMAAATLCGAAPDPSPKWDVPDQSVLCADLDYHDCIAATEGAAIRRQSGAVYRDGDGLVFRMDGRDFVLRDDTSELETYTQYSYWGRSGDFHLLRLQFYEGFWYAVLHAETGRLTKIFRGGFPVLSPTGDWIVAAAAQPAPHRSNVFDVWKRDEDSFVLVSSDRFSAETIGTPIVRWMSRDVVQVCWVDERAQVLGHLRMIDGEWKAEPLANERPGTSLTD